MLENLYQKPNQPKLVIRVADPGLEELLSLLLQEWRYQVALDPDEETTLLGEEGVCDPTPFQRAIWLNHSSYSSQGRLQIPFTIEELYSLLERRFHRPPRRHLRLAAELPARLEHGGKTWDTVISSLSDQGCRISIPEELVRGEHVKISFEVAGVRQQCESRVIYSMQRRPSPSDERFAIGLLFGHQTSQDRQFLRDFITSSYLLRVKQKMSDQNFQAGIQSIRLSAGVHSALDADT
ncbi:MAG: hypothetical protein C0616_04205 [Desulfuromonas sp.]|nr:MAG: hypothetical protein C0616_04205 [Desulfuromonas sp.]